MIDLYLLEELVALQKCGTLAKAADKLAVTQPTVTRGMQKLEQELGVNLFNREPNRITLTKTGEFAAKKAQRVLAVNEHYAQAVKNYALSESTITVAANAPGPLIVLNALRLKNVQAISREEMISAQFEQLLVNRQYTCLLINQAINTSKIASIYLGTEDLYVHLNEFTDLASHQEVSFAELKNLTFLVFSKIGFWRQISKNWIPGAKFLYQDDPNALNEIKNNSIFPYFTTNISPVDSTWNKQINQDRVKVTISDAAAHQQFYACFLKQNEKRLLPFIQQMQDKWAEVDQK